MDNDQTRWAAEVIRYAAALIGATSAGARKRARRNMISMALHLGAEAGEDIDALVADQHRRREYEARRDS